MSMTPHECRRSARRKPDYVTRRILDAQNLRWKNLTPAEVANKIRTARLAIAKLKNERGIIFATDIQKAVSDAFCIPLHFLKSERRYAPWTNVRHIAIGLTREFMPLASYPKIGQWYCRDHSTVWRSIRIFRGMANVSS